MLNDTDTTTDLASNEAQRTDAIEFATQELCEDIAHHLNWLHEQDPRMPFNFCLTVGLNLLNEAARRGARFGVVQNAEGLFEAAPSQ